jgi:ribonuclease BN (tRNA processing enzyme)
MTDNYSKNAAEFVEEVERFSNSKLNKKIEVIRLYEEALASNKIKEFEDLAFTAKYLRGLLRVLKEGQNIPEVGSMEKIKADFSSNMEKASETISDILLSSESSVKKYFNENFIEMSQDTLVNMNELLQDLEWVKIYLNDSKRKNES